MKKGDRKSRSWTLGLNQIDIYDLVYLNFCLIYSVCGYFLRFKQV